MVKVGQVEIGKVLAEVISDRYTVSTVNDIVQQPEQVSILKLFPQELLQDCMINGRIEFLYI